MRKIIGTPASSLGRRDFLKQTALAGAALGPLAGLIAGSARPAWADTTEISVFAPLPPDPAPPGDAKFSQDALAAWEQAHSAKVNYEAVAWPQLHDKMATNFASGAHVWDVIYMSGWVPEFAKFLQPYAEKLSPDLVSDMPPSSFSTVKWQGKNYGAVFTLSLLTLFYNTEHFEKAGLTEPPKTWDDLKRYAKELTRDGHYGWVLNYGDPAGIGGVASYWMTYLQQAGGKMYGDDGMPVFNNEAGVDALQLMVDLYNNGTDPGSISYVGINDATNVMLSGKASMMMNWPFTWKPAQDPTQSKIAGKLGGAVLPAGPAGTASIDGTDAWTVSADAKNPDLCRQLVEFYLSPDVQKQQALQTGWLPIRLSMLADADVQKALPNAAVVLEQSKHPYDSFVTPDYNEVTQAIGTEIQKTLQGAKTAKQAIQECSDQVTAIVKKRG
ncbi:MAG TPA: extracellular solute-binding protein [Candidatus Udaeobacter sp.]|nr:extracellular solute-binding protein [Candidatus Udaeobacter sp.]